METLMFLTKTRVLRWCFRQHTSSAKEKVQNENTKFKARGRKAKKEK